MRKWILGLVLASLPVLMTILAVQVLTDPATYQSPPAVQSSEHGNIGGIGS